MKGVSMNTKGRKLVPLHQRSAKRKFINEPVVKILDSDVTNEDFSSENTRQATERKRVSKSRVVASGFKPMTLNLDYALMALLHELYDGAGLKYTGRCGEKCFKASELSAMISYLITSVCDNIVANDSLGYKVYLHKILTVVNFRKKVQFENTEQICVFLNSNKYKRYTSALGMKKGDYSKWEPKNLKVYFEVNSVDELYKAMRKRKKMKKNCS
ncbi:hypothetical protein [Aeromonas hydrophila]|uniref:hypothetical protein n=1 Tax=Aeromonas TaxID=642 RepID=UPI001268B5A1|nr:hypothetical protein [Aeromonas hydrophila]